MKTLGVLVLAFACANALPPTDHLLGEKRCTWGPSYWCSNLTAAAGCHAVKHCIQTVWEHKVYPEDTDSVCQTCKNMVKQARDQLESNETQEEIKEVFEGSCKLIPFKAVSQECCKLADDFIPELIDTLASQMNPDVVCSVAGLCNSARIDKLIAEQANEVVTKHPVDKPDTCQGCHTVVDILEKRFKSMTRDEYLDSLLKMCGRMGSFSDACSDIIITYFSEIYSHTSNEFNSNSICMLSGECSTNFHVHEVEITPLSDVGIVSVRDDLPCELCEQLVGHLRDLLIADTTEAEFQKVLEGLCKQTGNFSKQCLSIVDEYYPVIYKFLVDGLNSTEVCKMIEICPNNGEKILPVMPLLPAKSALLAKAEKKPTLIRVGLTKSGSSVKTVANQQFENQDRESMQLPIERLHRPLEDKVYNKNLCTFCEYFLHYAQQAITDPKTEENIKYVIDKACTELPSSINETCIAFVNTYSDALVALLAQEIDPSVICPLIQVCPRERVEDIEIFMQGPTGDKPNCPLCLLAVTKLEEMVKDSRTRDNIKNALNNLCTHLSGNVRDECQDFVNAYTDELVEMLIDDFKPQEVCVYLRICNDNKPAPSIADMSFGGVISTNEIPDFTANGKYINPKHNNVKNKPQCVLCEFVIEKLDEILKDKKNEEEIKQAIHGICNHMPKSINTECNDFVTKYADTIFDLIVSEAEPDEICAMMNMCNPKPGQKVKKLKSPQCTICKLVMTQIEVLIGTNVSEADIKKALETVCSILPKKTEDDCDDFIEKHGHQIYDLLKLATQPGEICSLLFLCDDQHPKDIKWHIHKCAVCEATVWAMKTILENPKVDHQIEHVLEKACRALPPKERSTCKILLDEYGYSMYTLLDHLSDSNIVCKELEVCEMSTRPKREQLLGENKCTWGPGYWCASEENAQKCGEGAHTHCKEKVWKSSRPKRQQLVGSNKCTWGPSYWCESEENANSCGSGAHAHCTEKVWNGSPPK